MSWLAFAVPAVVLTVLIVLGYFRRWRWTGVAEIRTTKADSEELQPAKTLWDWLQLLVIPLVLAGLAFLLNEWQSDREHRREEDAAREQALRTYLTQMSDLILEHELLGSRSDADVRRVDERSR
jgi:hypothetical protein